MDSNPRPPDCESDSLTTRPFCRVTGGTEERNIERLPFVWKTRKFRGEFKWNGSSRWKFSGKIVIPFEVLFPLLPKRPKFSVPFVWITSARLPVERERKVYGYFVMVQLNPVPVFGAKKNTSTIWRKFFTEISVQMVSADRNENQENRKRKTLRNKFTFTSVHHSLLTRLPTATTTGRQALAEDKVAFAPQLF